MTVRYVMLKRPVKSVLAGVDLVCNQEWKRPYTESMEKELRGVEGLTIIKKNKKAAFFQL